MPTRTINRQLSAVVLFAALVAESRVARATLSIVAPPSRGFKLTTFATGFMKTGDTGPIGMAFVGGGSNPADYKVLVTNYYEGKLYAIPHFGTTAALPGPAIATYVGQAGALAQVPNENSYRYYLGQHNPDQIIEIDTNGTQVGLPVLALITSAIVPFPPAVPRIGQTGHLFVTENNNIWDVDPIANSKTLFVATELSTGADGLTFSEDANTIYVALSESSVVRGYDSNPLSATYKTKVWESPIHARPDGLATGTGILFGYIYANYNDGTIREFGVAAPHLGEDNLIAMGGTRGDFVAVDTNTYCPGGFASLLLTQSSEIVRLDPPGGGFFGPPTSSTSPVGSLVRPAPGVASAVVPALNWWGVLSVSFCLLSAGVLMARRRWTRRFES